MVFSPFTPSVICTCLVLTKVPFYNFEFCNIKLLNFKGRFTLNFNLSKTPALSFITLNQNKNLSQKMVLIEICAAPTVMFKLAQTLLSFYLFFFFSKFSSFSLVILASFAPENQFALFSFCCCCCWHLQKFNFNLHGSSGSNS